MMGKVWGSIRGRICGRKRTTPVDGASPVARLPAGTGGTPVVLNRTEKLSRFAVVEMLPLVSALLIAW